MYINYHKHTHYSNLRSLDCVVKPEDYCKRAVELGHKYYVCMEHGYQGNVFEAHRLCEEYGLKLIVGTEAYFVEDRLEKDKANYHIMILALNDKGYRQMNKIMSVANKDGYYYKPRVDFDLLKKLNPKNFIITTACVGGVARDGDLKSYEIIGRLKKHFGENLYLETQSHDHKMQKKHNEVVLKMKDHFGLKLIHGNDSHYILPKDAKYRDLFLKAKGIEYAEEEGFILDYPDTNTIIDRYKKQNILNDEQIQEALESTLVLENAEAININTDIKLPKVSKDPKSELKQIINNAWIKERDSIPRQRWQEYIEAIRYEMDIVDKTNMENYFILDQKIVDKAVNEYGGVVTKTGRGSAPSFYITKLLGLTDIDRLNSPITLYPTRFMSTARILETKSLPDIDINTSGPEPFIKATQDILGEDGCHWMISYKPLQDSSAFRLFCKAKDMDINEYNEVAKNIDDYVNHDYWKQIIEESKVFKGVIESVAPSPCSFLLLDTPISEEVGLLKVGDLICCNLDGYNCDYYKYLKNDILTVTVLNIIADTCKLANIPIPTIKELTELLDDKTYDLYAKGLTATLNQADTDFATPLVSKYAPKSPAEISAFVAAIRPGFASLLTNFLERRPYTTGVKELDDLLTESFHYLMYQENIMAFLIWLGIEESESYDILKKIAKKKFKESELVELHEILETNWIRKVGKIEGFQETWQVVEDASKYSFNASHSLSYAYDSLYGAYLKAHYPLEYYSVILNIYSGDVDKTAKIVKELPHFGIKLLPAQFGKSRSTYFFDKNTNSIYKGVSSIKYLNDKVGEDLYKASEKKYTSFLDLLIDIKPIINARQLDVLIKIGYFRQFGTVYKLLQIVNMYNDLYSKKTFKLDSNNAEIIKPFAKTITAKTMRDVDTYALCKHLSEKIPNNQELPISELIKAQIEYMGSADLIDDVNFNKREFIVTDINTKYTPVATLYKLCTGTTTRVKISKKIFTEKPLKPFDTIYVDIVTEKDKVRREGNDWVKTGDKDYFITYFKTHK